jgi:hypothetical protein
MLGIPSLTQSIVYCEQAFRLLPDRRRMGVAAPIFRACERVPGNFFSRPKKYLRGYLLKMAFLCSTFVSAR